MDGWDNDTNLLAAAILAIAAVVSFLHAFRFLQRIVRGIRRAFKPIQRRKPFSLRTADRQTQSGPGQTAPFALRKFWVVDGDTIRDNATWTVYRLENIDCPETDDRAKCYRERKQGERAKFEAIRLLKGAMTIIVRPSGKIDSYGRSVATIDIDGSDFGQLMIDRGFARPWRGVREDWCGPNGGLARMAEACSAKLYCKTCGARAGIVIAETVVELPTVDLRQPPPKPTPSPE